MAIVICHCTATPPMLSRYSDIERFWRLCTRPSIQLEPSSVFHTAHWQPLPWPSQVIKQTEHHDQLEAGWFRTHQCQDAGRQAFGPIPGVNDVRYPPLLDCCLFWFVRLPVGSFQAAVFLPVNVWRILELRSGFTKVSGSRTEARACSEPRVPVARLP